MKRGSQDAGPPRKRTAFQPPLARPASPEPLANQEAISEIVAAEASSHTRLAGSAATDPVIGISKSKQRHGSGLLAPFKPPSRISRSPGAPCMNPTAQKPPVPGTSGTKASAIPKHPSTSGIKAPAAPAPGTSGTKAPTAAAQPLKQAPTPPEALGHAAPKPAHGPTARTSRHTSIPANSAGTAKPQDVGAAVGRLCRPSTPQTQRPAPPATSKHHNLLCEPLPLSGRNVGLGKRATSKPLAARAPSAAPLGSPVASHPAPHLGNTSNKSAVAPAAVVPVPESSPSSLPALAVPAPAARTASSPASVPLPAPSTNPSMPPAPQPSAHAPAARTASFPASVLFPAPSSNPSTPPAPWPAAHAPATTTASLPASVSATHEHTSSLVHTASTLPASDLKPCSPTRTAALNILRKGLGPRLNQKHQRSQNSQPWQQQQQLQQQQQQKQQQPQKQPQQQQLQQQEHAGNPMLHHTIGRGQPICMLPNPSSASISSASVSSLESLEIRGTDTAQNLPDHPRGHPRAQQQHQHQQQHQQQHQHQQHQYQQHQQQQQEEEATSMPAATVNREGCADAAEKNEAALGTSTLLLSPTKPRPLSPKKPAISVGECAGVVALKCSTLHVRLSSE
ncbi:hypothetical protein DUNSADRAFT_16702 [Dunaliella salina]|uniref:Uncharacterized protein n=1 Tax=Dunaliella salina TaxID=3046 RepID=A0ABZ3KIM5_DUNSA|nr:hypothetical protein DUNSADRAFT_16702 [Dunaliella salina]|eukprot:KAF5829023.1 hypothetical protein DUNSADRAFT_16702 [Dunaliella salina]